MSVNLSFIGGAGWQFFDDNGDPLSGGKIYTYAAGTTTPLATYTSRTGATPNTNPIILDAAGRTPEQIWSTEGSLYKYVVKTSADVTIRTWDNIGGSVVASDLANDLANTSDNAKGDALIGFKQSGPSGFLTGATARTVNTKLQEVVSVKDFGATGDGVTNDAAAIQAALDAMTSGGTLIFPPGTYLCGSQITHRANVTVVGWNGATIKKGFNGDLWSIAVYSAQIQNITLNGSHGTYTGKGVVCSGNAACWRPVISNVIFEDFTDTHLEFTANSGESAIVSNCRFSPGSGQTDVRYIHFNGPDTTATFRTVTGCTCELGHVDVDGAQALEISNCVFKRVETDPACELVIISNMRWANSGGSVTIYGATYVVNCAIGGDVILDSTFGGVFVGNQQTAGTFTNNALGSTVIARDGSGGNNYMLGRLAAFYLPSGTERIQTGRMASVASTNQTLSVGGSARTIYVTGPLTGNITHTLSTTNAINGDRFRIARTASATGAFTIDVGGLKSLSVGQWCDVEYNGISWNLTAFGSL